MATLRYDGLANCPPGVDPESVSAPVAGVGWVPVGQTFEVEEVRALELLGKVDHIFVRVEVELHTDEDPEPETCAGLESETYAGNPAVSKKKVKKGK